ncbi:DNA gyrase subunit A [Hornefia butyriciproducens]|uniref:DNA gyrase subunit A n=1 Tax=Hornefia butyriciproducens TaxID=2652293 RepID=A0A6L5Y5Q5_9FIRM|nr:DNA gyrase subunit A [Hornefia butyriciproducens]MDD6298668.1 DNA gyrase subunit A [Hornefia butyriciproducens]MDY5464021.1 DNA gyrase subunit A [Hornefia butyriciproducens]MDY6211724.1 DNA gyrase subunit A [Hornefia butyriciproducens]MST51923.1 DNA gyrase subunit A [Hornefia butyriciproducens]
MDTLLEDKNIIQHEIHNEMKNSYIDYAMSVIVGRALPDVRDGMKPVHRRILYGMSQLGVTPDKPYKKSARIVGEVMGKYHPHGDSSIYDAMVRMAQDFSMRYPLVDGHGNFGSIDGDGAAAQRYTEARMSPFSLQMLRDIDKDTVDFIPNFDGEEKEPVVLPSRYPNLLVNGSNGIAVGMATSIPPHNLGEVIDATVKIIDNPEVSIDELMKIVKGPDFPTGAQILGKSGIRDAYRTGQGKIKVRAICEIEETNRGKSQIIVSEIPYAVNKARLIEKIAELIKLKKIDGISDIRDESSREGMRIVIELKRDANPQITLNQLYKHTQLQDNFSCIMIALVDGQPKLLNLYQILDEYIKFQKEVVTRRTQFDLAKAEARAHILEGLRIALDNIDEIIKIIRSAYNDAKEKLMERFGLSEIQAQAILDMRLARLQGLEREKIEKEYEELMDRIAYYKAVLSDEGMLMGVIKAELLEIKDKWNDKRRTRLAPDASEFEDEDLIEEEQVAVTLTHLGYIKRVPADTYKAQRRGGKGIMGITTRDNDFVKDLIMTSTHDQLMFFTNTGKAHRMKAFQIPEASRTAKGTPAVNFLSLMQRERITSIIPVKNFEEEKYLVAVTKFGTIKKTAISEYNTNRSSGIIAIKLKDGDQLIDIKQTTGKDNIIIVTRKGKCICFSEDDVRPMGRIAGGVRAIKLEKDDEVVSMSLVQPGQELLVVTENGYGKRTPVKEYKIQVRGGKGLLTYDKSKFSKTGPLIGAMVVDEDDEVLLINSDGIIIRIRAEEVSELGRATQGVKIMKVEDGTRIVAMAKAIREEDAEKQAEKSDAGEQIKI